MSLSKVVGAGLLAVPLLVGCSPKPTAPPVAVVNPLPVVGTPAGAPGTAPGMTIAPGGPGAPGAPLAPR